MIIGFLVWSINKIGKIDVTLKKLTDSHRVYSNVFCLNYRPIIGTKVIKFK